MFRVSFFVEDKNLATVMHSVSGRVRQLEVLPVSSVNVAPNGKLKEAQGNMGELLVEHIRKHKLERIARKDVQEWLEQIGRPNASAGTLLARAVKAGVLRPAQNRGKQAFYGVIHAKG